MIGDLVVYKTDIERDEGNPNLPDNVGDLSRECFTEKLSGVCFNLVGQGDLCTQALRPPIELCLLDGPEGGNGTPLGKKPEEVADISGARIGLTLRNCVCLEPFASPAARKINKKTTLTKSSTRDGNVAGLRLPIS
ncbi:hypothetical protein AgCh_014362 [Apium graveolens]